MIAISAAHYCQMANGIIIIGPLENLSKGLRILHIPSKNINIRKINGNANFHFCSQGIVGKNKKTAGELPSSFSHSVHQFTAPEKTGHSQMRTSPSSISRFWFLDTTVVPGAFFPYVRHKLLRCLEGAFVVLRFFPALTFRSWLYSVYICCCIVYTYQVCYICIGSVCHIQQLSVPLQHVYIYIYYHIYLLYIYHIYIIYILLYIYINLYEVYI